MKAKQGDKPRNRFYQHVASSTKLGGDTWDHAWARMPITVLGGNGFVGINAAAASLEAQQACSGTGSTYHSTNSTALTNIRNATAFDISSLLIICFLVWFAWPHLTSKAQSLASDAKEKCKRKIDLGRKAVARCMVDQAVQTTERIPEDAFKWRLETCNQSCDTNIQPARPEKADGLTPPELTVSPPEEDVLKGIWQHVSKSQTHKQRLGRRSVDSGYRSLSRASSPRTEGPAPRSARSSIHSHDGHLTRDILDTYEGLSFLLYGSSDDTIEDSIAYGANEFHACEDGRLSVRGIPSRERLRPIATFSVDPHQLLVPPTLVMPQSRQRLFTEDAPNAAHCDQAQTPSNVHDEPAIPIKRGCSSSQAPDCGHSHHVEPDAIAVAQPAGKSVVQVEKSAQLYSAIEDDDEHKVQAMLEHARKQGWDGQLRFVCPFPDCLGANQAVSTLIVKLWERHNRLFCTDCCEFIDTTNAITATQQDSGARKAERRSQLIEAHRQSDECIESCIRSECSPQGREASKHVRRKECLPGRWRQVLHEQKYRYICSQLFPNKEPLKPEQVPESIHDTIFKEAKVASSSRKCSPECARLEEEMVALQAINRDLRKKLNFNRNSLDTLKTRAITRIQHLERTSKALADRNMGNALMQERQNIIIQQLLGLIFAYGLQIPADLHSFMQTEPPQLPANLIGYPIEARPLPSPHTHSAPNSHDQQATSMSQLRTQVDWPRSQHSFSETEDNNSASRLSFETTSQQLSSVDPYDHSMYRGSSRGLSFGSVSTGATSVHSDALSDGPHMNPDWEDFQSTHKRVLDGNIRPEQLTGGICGSSEQTMPGAYDDDSMEA